MKITSFALQKGGTGKTSISVAVASYLAQREKVLLVDADPQGNATTWIAGSSIDTELADVLNDKVKTADAIRKTCIEGLYILPTAGLGGGLREYQKTRASGAPYAIADILQQVAESFDWCIIDTSPSFDPLNESVFLASDEVIAVLQFNEFSKDGLVIFTDNLSDARRRLHIPSGKAKLNKLVLNAKDERIKQQADVLATLQQLEKDGYSLFVVPVDQAFNKAQALHTSIQDLASTKKETTDAIAAIAKSLGGRIWQLD